MERFRVAAFVLALAALFGGAAVAGSIADVAPRSAGEAGGDALHGEAAMAAAAPVGLSLSDGGLVLAPLERTLVPGARSLVRFRVLDAERHPVRAFDLEHERLMHAIVVRRDLTGFQHLHPTMAADGTWSLPLRVAEPGAYRLFADFSTGNERRVLGIDLDVPAPTRRGRCLRPPLSPRWTATPSRCAATAGKRGPSPSRRASSEAGGP